MFLHFNLFTKKIVNISVFIIILSLRINSQSTIDNMIKDGLKLSYNFQMEKAGEIFDYVIKKFPDDPRGYHYKCTLYLWKYLGNNEQNDYENFISYSDVALEKAKEMANDPSKQLLAEYLIGSNYGYRAIAFGKAQKHLDMIWASKNSNSYLSEVIGKNPNYFDAYLGIGLFKFALSQVPSTFKWALNIIGFNGDQELGLRYLKLSAGKGDYSKVEAEYYLAQIYSEFLLDYEKSIELFKKLSVRFPNNILFQYSLAVNYIKTKELKSSEKILSGIIKSKNPYLKSTISFSYFLLGDVNFKRNEFEKAIPFYEIFISHAKNKDYKGIASYRLAICFEMLNIRDSSIKYFEIAKNNNSAFEEDLFAKTKGEIFFKRTISDEEKDLIKFSNMIDNALYKTVYDSLLNLIDKTSNNYIKPEAYLYLSDVCFSLKKYEESINYGTLVIQTKNGTEKWIKPFACYYTARAFFNLNEIQKANELIKNIDDYKEYDFSTKLKKQVKILIEKLN